MNNIFTPDIDDTERDIDLESGIPEQVQRLALRSAFAELNETHEADRRVARDRVNTILATCRCFGASNDDILALADKCSYWAGKYS